MGNYVEISEWFYHRESVVNDDTFWRVAR